jgi:hypothetical protein
LYGFCLTDAVSLAEGRFVASGYAVNGKKDDDFDRQAVLLYTPDDGQNWSIIYSNKNVRAINSLHAFKQNAIMAVGDGGFVLRVEIESLSGRQRIYARETKQRGN